MLSDTHVHFDMMFETGDTLDAIVARAAQAGVSRMIAVGGSPVANQTAVATVRAYPKIIRAVVGYNRDLAAAANPMDELEVMLSAPEVAAIGEIGLDFHHGSETAVAQIDLFQRMLLLARDPDSQRGRDFPVIVHTRAAEAETLAALRAHAAAWRGAPDKIGVMHCFTGGEVFARDLLALGFCISFSGIITFKNVASLRTVAALVPEDRLLIETDSPYLAPDPFRGQPNEPAHVRRVAEALAEIRHTSWETIAEITARNAGKMFFDGIKRR